MIGLLLAPWVHDAVATDLSEVDGGVDANVLRLRTLRTIASLHEVAELTPEAHA